MEQNTNEGLQEQTSSENLKEDTQELVKNQDETVQEAEGEQKPSSNGRYILWILAGGYLLYTAYSLCKGFIAGEEGTSIGFMLAGIAFAAVGAGLIFVSIKNLISEDRLKKAKEATDAAVKAAAGGELVKESEPETHKSMSIAERANLTKRLDDEEEDEKE